MMASRSLDVLYSDDVRHEVGGKISYIGCYTSEMWVREFPLTLPKLCITLWARIPHSNTTDGLVFRVFRDNDLLFEQEADVKGNRQPSDFWEQERPADMETFIMLSTTVIFSPMVVEAPCFLRVRAITSDGDELKAAALGIREAPQEFKELL